MSIGRSLNFIRYFTDFPFKPTSDVWEDTRTGGFGDDKLYVVQVDVWSRAVLDRMADIEPLVVSVIARGDGPTRIEAHRMFADTGFAVIALFLSLDGARRFLTRTRARQSRCQPPTAVTCTPEQPAGGTQ